MPRPPKIRIQAEICQKCGLCVEICPQGLFSQPRPESVPRVRRRSECIICGHCASVCPSGALEHEEFPPEAWILEEE